MPLSLPPPAAILLLFLVLLSSFFLGLVFSTVKGSDQWLYNRILKNLNERRWITYKLPDSVVEGSLPYPSLQQWLVSRFPQSRWDSIGKLLNPLYDVVSGILIAFVGWSLFPSLDVEAAGLLTVVSAWIFLWTPGLYPPKGRLNATKARSLSLLLVLVYLTGIALVTTATVPVLVGGLVSVMAGLLILLSSQFGLQVMVSFSVLLSLFSFEIFPVAVLAAVFSVAYAVPQLQAWDILPFYLDHKRWYIQNKDLGTTAGFRNDLRRMLKLPIDLFREPIRSLQFLYERFTPAIAVRSAPALFILLGFGLHNGDLPTFPLSLGQPFSYLWAIIFASLAVAILTSIHPLTAFGEAERYLQYSAGATALLFPSVVMGGAVEAGLTPAVAVLLLSSTLISINRLRPDVNDLLGLPQQSPTMKVSRHDVEEISEWFLQRFPSARILCVPLKRGYQFSDVINGLCGGSHPIDVYYRLYYSGDQGLRYREDIEGGLMKTSGGWGPHFDIPSKLPGWLSRHFGITHLVVLKEQREALEKTWGSPLDCSESLKETENFQVYPCSQRILVSGGAEVGKDETENL